MTRPILSLFNAYLGAYDDPYVAIVKDMEDIKTAFKRQILMQPDKSYAAFLQEKTVCLIGQFDDETGVITPCELVKVCDLAQFFPAGYLAKRRAQEEGGTNA